MEEGSYTTLQEGKAVGIVYRDADPVPVGAVMQGNFVRLRGKVITVRSGGVRTLNLVTDVRYAEGETYLSFRPHRPA